MKSFLGQKSLPRGIRNNNPGNLIITNIKWNGKIKLDENTDGKFEQFDTLQNGIRAMAIDITNDVLLKKLNTINKLINHYAPKNENDTNNYIKFVSRYSGIKPDEKFEPNNQIIAAIIKAQIQIENGAIANKYINDGDIYAAIETMPQKLLRKIKSAGKGFILLPILLLLILLVYAKK